MSNEHKKDQLPGLGAAYKAALPTTAVMALANFAKGEVDGRATARLGKLLKVRVRGGSSGVGVGRGLGTTTGLATMPIFLSGLKDLKSDDPERNRKGAAKIMLSGLGYGAMKGGVESYNHIRSTGVSLKALAPVVKRVAGVRGVLGASAGLLSAKAIANNQKSKSKSGKSSLPSSMAMGALIGAGKGALESPSYSVRGYKGVARGLSSKLHRKRYAPMLLKRIGTRSFGRAMAGAIGAGVVDRIAKGMT